MNTNKNRKKISLLMSCVGGALAPALIRLLKQSPNFDYRLIGVDASEPNATARSVVDAFHSVPFGDAPGYAERVLDIARKEGADIIWPASDNEALTIAGAAALFANAGIPVLGASRRVHEIIRDKAGVYDRLAAAGIPVPEYSVAATPAEVIEAVQAFDWPRRTIVLKPTTGRGGRGLHVLPGNDRPPEWLGGGQREQRHAAFVPDEEKVRAMMQGPTMVMPMMRDPGYDTDVLCAKNGKVAGLVVRQRYNPAGIPFTGNRIIADVGIQAYCRTVAECLGLDSLHDMDLLTDVRDGKVRLLEVNPRASGSIVASIKAGYPLIDAAVGELVGQKVQVDDVRGDVDVLPVLDVMTIA